LKERDEKFYDILVWCGLTGRSEEQKIIVFVSSETEEKK
jgi:hypothetical protein